MASGIYFYKKIEATSIENPSNRFIQIKKMLFIEMNTIMESRWFIYIFAQ